LNDLTLKALKEMERNRRKITDVCKDLIRIETANNPHNGDLQRSPITNCIREKI
jgi:hypothetical protein